MRKRRSHPGEGGLGRWRKSVVLSCRGGQGIVELAGARHQSFNAGAVHDRGASKTNEVEVSMDMGVEAWRRLGEEDMGKLRGRWCVVEMAVV
ncbi:putative formin-like protein 20 [Iris pallida]|uniref:Formin-like protein 20 n=1 Tax=Iris pallida TaxID=29817 RepID=A0AAX6GRR6_IRIPA|nr:putative formin-like protein 20 [Iris pallida]KAJ6831967.1 putative formin-like protein 20 [Iris pallida]